MYLGHKNYNAWNVSLWLNNDEGLYNLMVEMVKELGKGRAAEELSKMLKGERTGDGVKYTKTNIRAAVSGLSL